MSYLGIDLGTSGIKAVLIDSNQNVIGQSSASLMVSRPHSGWSEQDPASWIEATKQAVAELRVHHSLADVTGIGLSGQMHGAVLLDDADSVLRPAILWNDTRSENEARQLDAAPQFRRLTGNIVFPGFTAPKLVWIGRNEPATFARTAKVLLPKDYLRLWLTGEHLSDMSDSSGTSWLDVGARQWSDDLLEATGLSRAQMPGLVEGSEAGGRLRAAAASELGLTAGTVLAGGGGDNAASACGIGAIGSGAFVSIGTSGVLFASTDAFRPNADSAVHAFCHALPSSWHQMGVILSATDSLNWFASIAGMKPADLTGLLGPLEAPGNCLFLPYLSGERTPHNDARVRGHFMHLSHSDDVPALCRAVLEGVAFAFRDSLEALSAAGTNIDRVTAIGGGSVSRYWLNAIATVLQIPVDVPEKGEHGAAFGAARLAICATDNADPATVCTPPRIRETIHPNDDLVEMFSEQFERYQAAYQQIRSISP